MQPGCTKDAWAGKNFAAWFTDEGTDRNTNSLDQKLRQYYAVNTPEPHLEEDEFEDNVQLPELPLTVFENADDYESLLSFICFTVLIF